MDNPKSSNISISSMLRHYESQLTQLQHEVTILATQNKDYLNTIKVVTDENKELHAEIQDLVDEQMKKLTETVGSTAEEALKNLQSQLDLAHKERDAAINMNKETMQMLEKVQLQRANEIHTDQSKGKLFDETNVRLETLEEANLQMQMLVESLQQENKTLVQTTGQQIKELKATHDLSRDLKHKLVESVRENDEDKKLIVGLNSKLDELTKTKSELTKNCDDLSIERQQLQNAVVQAEGKLANTLQTLSEAHSQTEKLKMQLVALENINGGIEAKEMNYLMQIRESAQLLDDALLARDSALAREKQSQDDLEKASAAMETLVQEVADRVKSEVDKVKIQCNANIRRLTDEIELLELENANIRSEIDRAKRDKRSAEEELDLLKHHRANSRDLAQVEEMQRRCLHAERARDDLLITIQKLEEKLKRTELETEEERSRLLSTNQNLDQRLRRLQGEVEENQRDRYQLLEAVNQYKTENQKLEELSRSARLSVAKEFTVVEDKLKKEKKQLEVKLSSLESNHQTSIRNLHKMLADQQRIAARWKDESKHSSEVYQDQVKSLQAQLSRSRKKCQDLMVKLKATPILNDETAQLAETNRQLRAELHQSHYKTLSLAKKLTDAQSLSNGIGLRDLD